MSPQIEKQMQDDLNRFQNEVYRGTVAVPSNLTSILRKSYMAVAPQFHGFLANRIKVICSKQEEVLTNEDLSAAITIILKCPPEKLYVSFDDAIINQVVMEKFVLSYNSYVDEFQKKLQMKQANLISLTGGLSRGRGLNNTVN